MEGVDIRRLHRQVQDLTMGGCDDAYITDLLATKVDLNLAIDKEELY